MSEPFLGEIKMFAGTFAPQGWNLCDGSLLPIATNTALFNLLGTTYGGDGQTTFGVPDLRGRVALHAGQGPGGRSNYTLGQAGGTESVTIITSNLPAHSHAVQCSSAVGAAGGPKDHFPASCTVAGGSPVDTVYEAAADSTLAAGSVTAAGGSQPHNNIQPSLVVNFIIATEGIYPSQS